MDEIMDCDVDEQLDNLHHFQGSLADMLELARNLFDSDYGRWTVETSDNGLNQVHTIVTGGWSANEAVVSALQGTMFYFMAWRSSTSGGLHVYEISHQLLVPSEKPIAWGSLYPASGQKPDNTLTADQLASILSESLVQITAEQPKFNTDLNQLEQATIRNLAEIILPKIQH